ncbi:MAG: T9SS type A sorting domain-containing protein, partial [Thermotogae bacterium]|nr:T9SS type A sorting domain-containing protein [Thermotogota bacterium]
TDVAERPGREGRAVILTEGGFTVHLGEASYVGWDLYSADGRRIRGGSLGFVPAGDYEVDLSGIPSGAHILRVRIGERVMSLKMVRR